MQWITIAVGGRVICIAAIVISAATIAIIIRRIVLRVVGFS